MLQKLLIWAIFAIFLPPSTSQSCFKANESQCANADFVPGSDLAGEGFDITTMERKGAFVLDMSTWLQKDKTCTLCKNPYMNGQTQKLPVSVVDWRSSQKCKTKLSSSVYQSSESLVSASTSSIENNWKSDLQLMTPKNKGSVMMAGSNSKLAEYSMGKTKKDKFSFTTHDFSCGYYRYRVSNTPLLHPELNNELASLPARFDQSTKQLYYKLIDQYGTHYISKVSLGGEAHSVTSIKQCQASLQGLSVDEVKTCLDVEASASMGMGSSMQAENHHCKNAKDKTLNKKSFSSSFSDREASVIGGYHQIDDLLFSSNIDPKAYKQWVTSLPAHPGMISYSLQPLHHLLPGKNPIQKHLRKAISDYIQQRALLIDCTKPCKTGGKTNPREPCSCTCLNSPVVNVNCCPTQKGLAEVTVTVIKAKGLYGDYFGATDAYVKVISVPFQSRTTMIESNSPTWNRNFYLGPVLLTNSRSVTLEVWDEDKYSDELLGSCKVRLKSGTKSDMCTLTHGMLYYKVQVKCTPGLSGVSCSEYTPSPMDAQLEKKYVSRHARPIPRDMLLEMGVLLDERIPHFNQSNNRKATGIEL